MTYKEALVECCNRVIVFDDEKEVDLFYMCMDALKKQIPRKPEEYWDGYANGYPVIEYQCPCCGRDVDDTDHHCVCGQAIDWSEEE